MEVRDIKFSALSERRWSENAEIRFVLFAGDLYGRINAQRGVLFPEDQV